MELRHLRQFAAVADTLHFGRAAERLHIAQPALSQGIRTLESELGVRLLNRTNRHVELSDAGQVFLAEIGEVLVRIDRAADAARLAGAGKAGRLRLGYTRSSPEGVATRVVEEFRRTHPAVQLEIDTAYTARNVEGLRSGRLDAAFVCPPLAEADGLALFVVGCEPFVAVLPRGHRLAGRRRIRRADLHEEPLVTGARERGPGFFDTMFREIWGSQPPRIVQVEADEEHILRAVSRGTGVSVITESRARTLSFPGVVVRRFDVPPPRVDLALAWRKATCTPVLERFIEVAREIVGRDEQHAAGARAVGRRKD